MEAAVVPSKEAFVHETKQQLKEEPYENLEHVSEQKILEGELNGGKGTVEDSLSEIACAICFEMIVPGDYAVELPCSHIYHSDCIVQWLLKNKRCPICRTLLPSFDFQDSPSSSRQPNTNSLVSTTNRENSRVGYQLTRLNFSDSMRRTSRLLFIKPGLHMKHSFLQFSSLIKLVFHHMKEPFRSHSDSNTSHDRHRMLMFRQQKRNQTLVAPGPGNERNIFRRMFKKFGTHPRESTKKRNRQGQ
eukprot:jgi/Galph1/3676/GphlegSOOS_G2329.1